jgi:hypothetical protein
LARPPDGGVDVAGATAAEGVVAAGACEVGLAGVDDRRGFDGVISDSPATRVPTAPGARSSRCSAARRLRGRSRRGRSPGR